MQKLTTSVDKLGALIKIWMSPTLNNNATPAGF
jgi:hypothetical protein